MVDIIKPLLNQGLSPDQILQIHPELNISEKTLCNNIEGDVFHEVSVLPFWISADRVSRRLSKKKANSYKKRQGREFLTDEPIRNI